jgi:ATPase family protein associated with various cellular activities (AAA)
MSITNDLKEIVQLEGNQESISIQRIFFDSRNKNNIHNTHFRVFRKEIDTITNALFDKKSVIVYCDKMVARKIGECLLNRISQKSESLDVLERLNPMEGGFLKDETNREHKTASGIRNIIINEIVSKEESWIIYNFDVISTRDFSNFSMEIDIFYNILEKKVRGTRFVLFVDSDVVELPKYFEKYFDVVHINGISSPGSLLPVLTFKEFKKIAKKPDLIDWDFVNIEDISLDYDKIFELYNYLSAFTPEQIRVILKMSRVPGEDFISSVKANRNKYLRDFMNLYALHEEKKIEIPWLQKEKKQIIDLLLYSQQNIHINSYKKIKGILLYGPPGNSKTVLIKSLCQDAEMNYIIVSASDIKSRYMGDSEKAVKDLFKRASQASPCILVFDEMEALFMSRDINMVNSSGGMMGIVNTLLQEMDSIQNSKNVFVIGTTNKPEIIDRAFLRPGRFDRAIQIDYPERKDIGVIVKYFIDFFYDDNKKYQNSDVEERMIHIIEDRFDESKNKKMDPFSVADISHIIKMLEVEEFAGSANGINKIIDLVVANIDSLRKAMGITSKNKSDDDSII